MQESKPFARAAVVDPVFEDLYPKLFSVPPVACVAFDQTGQVLWSNGRMEGWFDADVETLGPWFQNTWVLQDKALQEARVAQIQGSKGVLKATWLHQHLDQEIGHRLAWTWVADQDSDRVYALACDVTRAWLVRQKHHEQFKALKQSQIFANHGCEKMTKLADVRVLVAITGDAPDGIAPEIRRCFQAVLQKPFTQTQLQATLVRLLLHPETPRLVPLARSLAPVINH